MCVHDFIIKPQRHTGHGVFSLRTTKHCEDIKPQWEYAQLFLINGFEFDRFIFSWYRFIMINISGVFSKLGLFFNLPREKTHNPLLGFTIGFSGLSRVDNIHI